MQRTKQALGIAPHEALFKKNKHTKTFTETLQRIVIYEHEAIQKPISENNIGAPLVPQKVWCPVHPSRPFTLVC